MRSVSDKVVEIKNKHFIIDNMCFLENRAVYEKIWKKYFTAGQAIVDSMAHACGMLDN